MKLKKKVKVIIILFLLIVIGVLVGLHFMNKGKTHEIKEIKIVNKIEKYGYNLKENKPSKYKKLFKELKKILEEKEVNEEEYVKKLTELFIYDFYSLNDKTAKTDIGGVEFIYNPILANFLENAQDTYYKYIENNIYNNRNQKLPIVGDITINTVEKKPFAYGDKTDEQAYVVNVSWTYTDAEFSKYQKQATLVFIHDEHKLSLVELQ